MDEEKDKLSRTLAEKEIFPEDGQPKPKELLENVKNSSDRYLTGWRLTLVTISLVPGMFLKGVDSSVIGVATPGITTSFHTIDDLAWYGSGYMLPHSALQPSLGAFYKSFNRTLAIVGLSVPKRKIPLYYVYVLSVQGFSACTAPIFGGTFTDKLTWRWCFWINLPIGGVALAMVMLFVKQKLSKQAKDIRSLPPLQRLKCMDWAGTIIFLSAFVCLYLALQWSGQTKPWRSSEVIGFFISFGLLLGLFASTQKITAENSLIPRRILKQRTVLFGTIYLVLFGLQMAVVAIRGTSALHGGVRMIAIDAGRIVFIIILSILVTKFGHYMPYMTDGTIITAIAAGLLTMFDIDTSTARSTAFMFLAGAGAGTGGNQPFTAL
ncbi:hypothetical protein ABEW05_001153 [Botrytis cinerea]